jgi:hypothetical protein
MGYEVKLQIILRSKFMEGEEFGATVSLYVQDYRSLLKITEFCCEIFTKSSITLRN